MAVHSYAELKEHIGHEIACVGYGNPEYSDYPTNVSVECETCSEVLLSFDREEKTDAEVSKV